MIQPTNRSLNLLAISCLLAFVPVVFEASLWTPWLIFTAVIIGAIGTDGILLAHSPLLEISLEHPEVLYIGSPAELHIIINKKPVWSDYWIEALSDFSDLLTPQLQQRIDGGKDEQLRFIFTLKPLRRGTAYIENIWLRWPGPWGLMRRTMVSNMMQEIPIVPDYHSVKMLALRFFTSREYFMGIKVERFTGEGSEFDHIKEYIPGLDHRSIDWKASARHRQLLCREYRAERNHLIILTFDTGYLMSESLAGIPRLDHAINQGLLLSYVSLQVGDRVGIFAFDQKVRAFLEPRSGLNIFPGLQIATSKLDYSENETNFTLGLAELATRLRRRALIIVFTDFVDTITAELMIESLGRLVRKHLVLFVSIRDQQINNIAYSQPKKMSDIAQSVVASDFLEEREKVMKRLYRKGVQIVEATPDLLSLEVINRYLDIKRREMIA